MKEEEKTQDQLVEKDKVNQKEDKIDVAKKDIQEVENLKLSFKRGDYVRVNDFVMKVTAVGKKGLSLVVMKKETIVNRSITRQMMEARRKQEEEEKEKAKYVEKEMTEEEAKEIMEVVEEIDEDIPKSERKMDRCVEEKENLSKKGTIKKNK